MPQLLSFTEDGLQFAWDATSIKIAEECLYKYKLKMLDGWTPQRKSVHLEFGGWYAAALESFHKYRADGMDHEEALIEVVHEALQETWVYETDEAGDPIPGTGSPWQSDHNAKTRENLIRTIIWYTEQFRDDPCQTVILGNGQAAVEHSFRLDADDGIVLSGHLDRLVEYGGKPYIQDQKTSSSTITPRYFEQWQTNTQMSLYSFAGRTIFNLQIKGVIIDAAQIAVGFSRFERGFTFRDEAQLNEWYDHAMFHINSARTATRENYFPMNRSSCNNYGGCQFRHVCGRSPHVREQFLKADFERGKRWDPLEVR
jgi:hypothetical protein